MSRLAALRQLDTSSPAALRRDLGRLVQELDSIIDALERRPYALTGNGSPEGIREAPEGSFYFSTDGGATTTLYVKESGGNTSTGWEAK